MAEDTRTIKEGAGLVESRLNVEFIDWLRKWSTPMLAVLAVVALGYFAYQKVNERRAARVAEAFSQLEQASAGSNPSPESLKAVAAEFGDVRAVGSEARLRAAEAYLRAVRLRVKVSANLDLSVPQVADVNFDGTLKDPANELTEENRASYLAEAESLYQVVLDENRSRPERALQALQAAYGLAAVAESRGDAAEARTRYAAVAEIAAGAGMEAHAQIAQQRADGVEELLKGTPLYRAAELPADPAPPLGGVPMPEAPLVTSEATPPAGEEPAPETPAPESPAVPSLDEPLPQPTPSQPAPEPAEPPPA